MQSVLVTTLFSFFREPVPTTV